MRPCLAIAVVLAAFSLPGGAIAASAGGTPPTAAQMKADVARAEKSAGLWATVNICNTAQHPDTVGIRGQIPAPGFPATMLMRVTLQYYSVATGGFTPVPGAAATLHAGTASSGFRQQGVSFKVTPPAILSATITFSWLSGTHVIGSITRTTRGGITGVQQSDPARFSAGDCRIGE